MGTGSARRDPWINGPKWTAYLFLQVWGYLSTVVLGSSVPHFSQFYFTVEPSNIVAIKGEPAYLNCSAYHGDRAPSIQWIKDGEFLNLDGDDRRRKLDNGSLYFNEIVHLKSHRNDKGFYQCAATIEGLGTIVSRKAFLNIAHLKNFEVEPQDATIYLQDTALFECRIDGVPHANISWYKDGALISSRQNVRVYPEGVLEITSVQFSDFGAYKCVAENSERSRTSRTAHLIQNPNVGEVHDGIEPAFVVTPRDTRAREGSVTMLFCGANGPDKDGGQPSIIWLKDGVTIDLAQTQGRLNLVGAGHLQILNVEESDAGTYTCRAENLEDSIDADATLSVLVSPRVIGSPKNIFAHVHSDILLQCAIYGIPKPTITWMKNSDQVIPSDYFQIVDGHDLRILGLVSSDDGLYQCFGENELGSVQTTAQLVTLQKDIPLPTTPSHAIYPNYHTAGFHGDQKNLPSKPMNLVPAIVSTRFVTLSWRIPERTGPSEIIAYSLFWKDRNSDRERVLNTTATEANVQHLKPDTEYVFRVQAFNRFGPSTSFAMKIIKTDQEIHVPSPARNVRATPLSPTTIKVEWDPPINAGGISHYKLFFYQVGDNDEYNITVNQLSHTLINLEKFREYSFRVVACNQNGPGMSTEEFVARTYSDVPDAEPLNFNLETASSTSLIVRWEPPPEDQQNGIITGYKIRFKRKGNRRRSDTVTTDGNRRLYALTELRKSTEYQVRVQSLTVNGTGPATPWKYATTYKDDLDETTVPPSPARLMVRPLTNSIIVSWTAPPQDSKILVRGYILGFGKGIPDVYRQTLEPDQMYYTIENLQPASEYVITIRAFNNRGDGPPRYETVITSEESKAEPVTPMMPPIGLKAIVLSANTIVVTWADTSLGRSQRITDNRYYTVRFCPYLPMKNRRFKYLNSTDLNAHIDDLKPDTQYEFVVRVIKGRRQSTWSMSVINSTQEAAPGSMPRDLTPVPVEDNPMAVTLNWQPPSKPYGQITGYLVFYTTDSTQDDIDWVVEGVLGDKLSTTIKELTPDTTYYFKVQARNSKGYGPMSPTEIYRTPKADGTGGGKVEMPFGPDGKGTRKNFVDGKDKESKDKTGSDGVNNNLMIIIIACAVGATFCIVIAIVTVVLCRRRDNNARNAKIQGSYKSSPTKGKGTKNLPKDVKPPDLWIHHHTDQLELRNMEKPARSMSNLSMASTRRNSHDTKSIDDLPTAEVSYHSGSEREEREKDRDRDRDRDRFPTPHGQQPRSIIRPKPIMIPVDTQAPPRESTATVTAMPNGHMMPNIDPQQSVIPMRPVYPRTQYNMQYSTPPRVNAGDLAQTPSTCKPLSTASLGQIMMNLDKLAILEEDDSSINDALEESFSSRVGYGPPTPDSPSVFKLTDSPSVNMQSGCIAYEPQTPDGSKSLPRPHHHPLKSFSLPAPPIHSAPGTPAPTHIVKPQQSSSPYKKPTPPISSGPIKPRSPMPIVTPKAPDVTMKPGKEDPDIQKSLSTEELSAEMANLEGLMKDLNAITQQDFEC